MPERDKCEEAINWLQSSVNADVLSSLAAQYAQIAIEALREKQQREKETQKSEKTS